MKYIVLVPDGMADHPVEKLGGKTPLQVADTPCMDSIVARGLLARARTVPAHMSPASDVANLSILGYDPHLYYSGRAPLEAAYLGVGLNPEDVAFRCNLVTVSDEKMADYSSGHISSQESSVLIDALNQEIGSPAVRFYPGVSYRHLLVLKGFSAEDLTGCLCVPPHDILGESFKRHLPQGKGADILCDLMEKSRDVLGRHEINRVRLDLHENPANMIWLWGQGQKLQLPSFLDKFGLSGAVICAVDLIKGIGRLVGLEVINVEGATGYYDTNYAGKAEAGMKALERLDFVFIHVEATDEAGHNGDLRNKIACIERFDKFVVGTVLNHLKSSGRDDWRLMVLPDHATPVEMRKHVSDEVCVAMMGKGIAPNGFSVMSEEEASKSTVVFEGHQLMDVLLR